MPVVNDSVQVGPEKFATCPDIQCPRHPVIFLADDWGVQSPSQHSILAPLPFSEGDWIPRDVWSIYLLLYQKHSPFMWVNIQGLGPKTSYK